MDQQDSIDPRSCKGREENYAGKQRILGYGRRFTTKLVQENKGLLLPIDSEHNAIFQVLPSTYKRDPKRYGIKKIILTASGGPFYISIKTS